MVPLLATVAACTMPSPTVPTPNETASTASTGDSGPTTPLPTAADFCDVRQLVESHCFTCHSARLGFGDLDLQTSMYTTLRGLVVPGDPPSSLLMRRMWGEEALGDVMPPSGILPPATLELVRLWIADGALEATCPTT